MARPRSWAVVPFVCSNCKSILPLRPSFTAQATAQARTISSTPNARGLVDRLRQTAKSTSGFDPNSSLDFTSLTDSLSATGIPGVASPRVAAHLNYSPPHRIHIFATKHNTHMTLTAPPPKKLKLEASDAYKPPEPNKPVMTYATGMIGFKKHHRSSYDAAFQLASYFLKQIQERGLIKDIKEVEVVLRGFGSGREAATKVILGQEGRLIRSKIVAVTDATRLKFGGSRSPNPRRLG